MSPWGDPAFGGSKLYAVRRSSPPAQVLAVRMGGRRARHAGVHRSGAGLCVLAYWRSWQLPVISDQGASERAADWTGERWSAAPSAHDGGPLKASRLWSRGRATDGSTPSEQPEQG